MGNIKNKKEKMIMVTSACPISTKGITIKDPYAKQMPKPSKETKNNLGGIYIKMKNNSGACALLVCNLAFFLEKLI